MSAPVTVYPRNTLPSVLTMLSVRVAPELIDVLDAAAAGARMSRSDVVRDILAYSVDPSDLAGAREQLRLRVLAARVKEDLVRQVS